MLKKKANQNIPAQFIINYNASHKRVKFHAYSKAGGSRAKLPNGHQ